MVETLTPQQKMAVQNRGGKLLVSAAAGSGKTKVLVDRLLLYLTESDGKINIDDFLIITYTKAAASELRGKIAAKLNERLAENPGSKHLQRQLQRLYLTKISTVHAFCADILREYAYRLDIPADFRVADEQECLLLQLQVMDKLLDEAYAEGNSDFIAFVDSQALGRDDRTIPQIILKVYNSARCHILPEKWLNMCIQSNESGDLTDVSQTVWGQYLIQGLHSYLDMQIEALSACAVKAEANGTMEKPAILLQNTVVQLKQLRSMTTWDSIVSFAGVDFGRLTFSKNCTDLELAERIKAIRKACKDGLEKKLHPFADFSSQVLKDLNSGAEAVRGLIGLVHQFSDLYEQAKKSRRILDFGDLEHKTLDLLVGKQRSGVTNLATEIGQRFTEIMVDEYQDSNAVQDMIFAALTHKRQNCFMVGDVKQSIYQFRLADPGIFLEKYHSFAPAESASDGEGRKIMLSSNFRSAGSVIQAVNDVFTNCMYEDVGGLQYGDDEMLHEGIPHISPQEPEVELCVVDVQEDTYQEEAAYTADRICELLDGTHMVRNGDAFRPITPDDIVILLRSPGSVGGEFRYALESRGIRVNFGNGGNLLETEEVSFLRSFLQVLDNPLQDIPLVAVLTSRMIGFHADELAAVRAGSRKNSVYESLLKSENTKVTDFLELLNTLREEAKLCTLSQLVDKILSVTRMDSIVSSFPDGSVRLSNLRHFCNLVSGCENNGQKELGQFLDFLTASEEKGLTVTVERTTPGAVTIMSIHKSKGLEFPVVFLCGLSRDFNREDARAQILCHKEFGIGLNCVDMEKRIRYPSVSKKAIAAKILADGLSEEMRVLYVAMTRARDRLIMTYAVKNPDRDIADLVNRMDICDKRLLISGADCPGTWILLTALGRMESGALFALGGRPDQVQISENPWKVTVACAGQTENAVEDVLKNSEAEDISVDISRLQTSLSYQYPHLAASAFPSKLTATQLKGRQKDQEASENAGHAAKVFHNFRVPSFASQEQSDGVAYGNIIHSIMQHIDLKKCSGENAIGEEIARMCEDGIIPESALQNVDTSMLWMFFDSPLGRRIRNAEQVLREFKFSVLTDAAEFDSEISQDEILLQGVVDCAIMEPDDITVIDFKTDRVTDNNLNDLVMQYSGQVMFYARVLSRIWQKEVTSASLYFFRKNLLVPVM